jgi:histone H3/H4
LKIREYAEIQRWQDKAREKIQARLELYEEEIEEDAVQ